MNTKPIATALVGKDHIMVLADIIADRLNALHQAVGKNRVYLIGGVDASALYWLAQQFDVLGYRGWFLADTEEQRRELIRRAIELHRYKGTPWAVKEAIKSLGFTDVTIQERVGLYDGFYNNTFQYDESHTYGSEGVGEWATFRVIIGLSDWTTTITPDVLTALLALINEYKNVRSHLVGLSFAVNAEDDLQLEDVSDYGNTISDEDELTGFSLTYDGTASADGEYDYDTTGDSLQITGGEPVPVEGMVIEFDTTMAEMLGGVSFAIVTALVGQEFQVDWGDGTIDTITSGTSGMAFPLHAYASQAVYNVTIIDPLGAIIALDLANQFDGPFAFSYNATAISNWLPTIQYLFLYNNPQLSIFDGANLPLGVSVLECTNTGFSTAEVNAALIRLDENGLTGGSAQFDNSGNPDGDGITAIVNLLAKDWGVTWDI